MSPDHSCFALAFLLLEVSTAGALYGHAVVRCLFTSRDDYDAEYLEQYYFNKELMIQYNSTVGKIVGFTNETMTYANILNKNHEFMGLMVWKTERCKNDVPLVLKDLLNPVEPYVRFRSVKAASSKHSGLLMCSVYNFYPKQIKVTWLRDGKEVTDYVSSTDELSNGNWLYQIHSYLEFTPRPGEKITCMVKHASFKQPMLYDLEPVTNPGRSKIALGAAGLLLGLAFLIIALIYYKKNYTARELVPTTFYVQSTN